MRILGLTFLMSILMTPAIPLMAQDYEEIIVTARKRESTIEIPGVTLEKRGDSLLLEAAIFNDSRNPELRKEEITKTARALIAAAQKDSSISLSLIDGNGRLVPFTLDAFLYRIGHGGRVDTSRASLQLKTTISDEIMDSYALSRKLETFIESVDTFGRSDVTVDSETIVTVINPEQYRPELLRKITTEIRTLTESLGPDYRVIIENIDGQMGWVRSGDINLAFFIPYDFKVIPTSLNTYMEFPNPDDY